MVRFHLKSFVAAIHYFFHRSKIIRTFNSFNVKMAIFLLGFPSLKTTQAATGLILYIRVIKAFNMPWLYMQSEGLLHLCHNSIGMPVWIHNLQLLELLDTVKLCVPNRDLKFVFYRQVVVRLLYMFSKSTGKGTMISLDNNWGVLGVQ
jgi:hypothetical protein